MALIAVSAATVGAFVLVARALKARLVPVVRVVTRDGRVLELPENDPRISSRL